MLRKVALHSGGENPAPRLPLEILIPPDVVRIGVGVVDRGETPAVGVQNLPHLAPGVLIAPAVNQADTVPLQANQADFGRTLDITASVCDLDQFVHDALPSLSCGFRILPPGLTGYSITIRCSGRFVNPAAPLFTARCPHRSYRLCARSFPPHSELNEKSRAAQPKKDCSARLSFFLEGRQTPQNRDTPEMVRGRSVK